MTSWQYQGFFGQFEYGEHVTHSLDAQFLEHRTIQYMKTVPSDLLARECLCMNLG